uniref:Uncharacterized protein n=1 Tax=Anguilla anguilla TaxID=7936 RepID=A0A0E9VD49_ANGAN
MPEMEEAARWNRCQQAA